MAEIWKPLTIETYQSWIDALINESTDDLNDWEIKFIHSLEFKLNAGWQLTQAQAEILERIYAEKTK